MQTTHTVPTDLVALELARREAKAKFDVGPKLCRYALYRTERDVAAHQWLVERKADWRSARKSLRLAADALLAEQAEHRRVLLEALDDLSPTTAT
jgi:hypothetical protein